MVFRIRDSYCLPTERRLFAALMLAVSTIIGSGCSGIPTAALEMVDAPAPYTRLFLMDGTEIPLEAEKGKHVMVMFWATWCGHSKAAIDDFESLARKYQKRRDVTFLAISVDRAEDYEALKGRIKSQGLKTVTHAFSGNDIHDEAYSSFHGEVLPYFVAIDLRGIVRVVDSDVSSIEDYLESKFQ